MSKSLDIDEPNVRTVEDRTDQLLAVVFKHFPHISDETLDLRPGRHGGHCTVGNEADAHDCAIRDICVRLTSVELRKIRGQITALAIRGAKTSTAVTLRKMRDAIDRADSWAYVKASAQLTEVCRDIVRQARRHMTGSDIRWIGDLVLEECGPLSCGVEFWQVERSIIERALSIAAKRRRPTRVLQDAAVLELVGFWATLAGADPREPHHAAKNAELPGSLRAFSRDALAVYADVGLAGALPHRSNSAWRRILADWRQ